MDKAETRKKILLLRDSMDRSVKQKSDEIIRKKVISLINDRQIDAVLTYVSFRSEVDTYGIIGECLERGIQVAVPRVHKPHISFYLIGSTADLTDGYMGIREPSEGCTPYICPLPGDDDVRSPERVLLIAPGSVFDAMCDRIGYGGGYYDRFLDANPDIYSVGLAYGCQMVDAVPVDEWDHPVDMVITDEEIYHNTHQNT